MTVRNRATPTGVQRNFYRLTPSQQQFAIEQAHDLALSFNVTFDLCFRAGAEQFRKLWLIGEVFEEFGPELERLQPGITNRMLKSFVGRFNAK